MSDQHTDGEYVVVLNPVSGSGDHAAEVRERATSLGYTLRETSEAGDSLAFAREAARDGASLVAAAGGDGTLNEVVRGVAEADALDRVTIAVIPAGTGNNFAGHIGITSIEAAFDAIEDGERRQLDLGGADDHVFVNSCVGGLTADASAETTPELKSRFGVLAYVLTTLQTMAEFDGLPLEVRARDGDDTETWSGEAICVLVGNGRKFTMKGGGQADMEDGRFDVTIVEDAPMVGLVGEALVERLLGEDAPHATRLRAVSLDITGLRAEPINFSLDGEMVAASTLSLDVRPGALRMVVGDEYDPHPDGD